MLVLEIVGSVDPRQGGVIEGILQQAPARRALGLETHIVSLDAPDDRWVRECPVRVFACGNGRLGGRSTPLNWIWTHYGYTPGLVAWLRHNVGNYDVAVVNGLWNYSTLAARRVLPGSRVPYVVFTHGMLDPWFRREKPLKHAARQAVWLFSEGVLLRNAQAVLFTTEDEMTRSQDVYWPYGLRARCVGYGTADACANGGRDRRLAAFRQCVPALKKPFLLFLGRIHPKKGCDLLIEAFAQVAAAHPGIDVVIAGPDQAQWRGALEALAAARGVADRIHWPGPLFGDAKWGAFLACEAFVLPSHQENFGVAVVEALAAGKPVLVTDQVGIWRDVRAAGAGLIGKVDLAGVRQVLETFLALSPDQKERMGRAARDCFLRRYEISIPVGQFRRLIAEITSERSARAA
jgi:glycosyltransferase involved in cell wall biosynthesis